MGGIGGYGGYISESNRGEIWISAVIIHAWIVREPGKPLTYGIIAFHAVEGEAKS